MQILIAVNGGEWNVIGKLPWEMVDGYLLTSNQGMRVQMRHVHHPSGLYTPLTAGSLLFVIFQMRLGAD
jgi:hypothetical protein